MRRWWSRLPRTAQQRAHQPVGFRLGRLTAVHRLEHPRADAAGPQLGAMALREHPVPHRVGAAPRLLEQVVARAEVVEHRRRIGEQVLPPVGAQPQGVGEHPDRIDLGQLGDAVEEGPAGRSRRRGLESHLERRFQFAQGGAGDSAEASTGRVRSCRALGSTSSE